METHNNGPTSILQKHIDLNPKGTIVISINDKNTITLDISHPMDLNLLAILSKFSERHLDRVMDKQMGQT